jgi:hypothetical protein
MVSHAGTYWPLVEEGDASGNHGTVICKLCVRHGKNNNFTGDGYQCAAVRTTLHVRDVSLHARRVMSQWCIGP